MEALRVRYCDRCDFIKVRYGAPLAPRPLLEPVVSSACTPPAP
jgi:hypothetical protein